MPGGKTNWENAKHNLAPALFLLAATLFAFAAIMGLTQTSDVRAQGVYLWEEFCPSTHRLTLSDSGYGVWARCDEVSSATNTPQSTQTTTPTGLPTNTPPPPPTATLVPAGIRVIDHSNVNLYDSLTAQQKALAQAKKVYIVDRSVGQNISEGLDCLAAPSWEASLAPCRNYYTDETLTALTTYADYASAPAIIQFPGGDYRANITYYADPTNRWETFLTNFIAAVPGYYAQGYRDFAINFNYLMVQTGSTLDERFFDRARYDYVESLEQLEQQYPELRLFYMTTSLARMIGTQDSRSFNDQIRQYASQNGKYLLDLADLEAHKPNGEACLLNGIPVICKDYTVEVSGGHLISGGKIRIAKALWLLLAQE